MTVHSHTDQAAVLIEQTFRRSIIALAADTSDACARTINRTGFQNIPAEQVLRFRLILGLAGPDQELIFGEHHKIHDPPHILWAYFCLFQAAAATLVEVAYDGLVKIEKAQSGLPKDWALERCMKQCERVSDGIELWTQNATHPYEGKPWLAPSYLCALPREGVWGIFDSDWFRLDEPGTALFVGMLKVKFNLTLLAAAIGRYEHYVVAAAQQSPCHDEDFGKKAIEGSAPSPQPASHQEVTGATSESALPGVVPQIDGGSGGTLTGKAMERDALKRFKESEVLRRFNEERQKNPNLSDRGFAKDSAWEVDMSQSWVRNVLSKNR